MIMRQGTDAGHNMWGNDQLGRDLLSPNVFLAVFERN